MDNKRPVRRWWWWFTLIGGAAIVLSLFSDPSRASVAWSWLTGLLTPFIGGFALAFLLLAPSRWVEGLFLRLKGKWWRKLARPLALIIVYLALFGILALLVSLIIPRLITSLTGLFQEIPGYLDTAQQWLTTSSSDGLLGMLDLTDAVGDVYATIKQTVLKVLTTENVMTAVQSVLNVTSSILDAVLAFIISVYMLAGREKLVGDLKKVCGLFMPRERVAALGDYSRRVGTIFYKYLYGAFLDALVVGVVVSVGLLIFGVPYAVLLGMLLGLLNMIPYFGALFGGIFVSLIALLSCNIYTAVGVAIYIVVAQQLDANILQPRVVGDTVGIRPIYVLLAVTFFGGLFGFWGVFLGVPIMAVIQMLVKEGIAAKAKQAK